MFSRDIFLGPCAPADVVSLGPGSSMRLLKAAFKGCIDFDMMWQLRPATNQYVQMFGKSVTIPRRQLAMGKNYAFAGQITEAVPWNPHVLQILKLVNDQLGLLCNCLLYTSPRPRDS